MRLAVAHFPAGALALPRGGEPVFVPSVAVPPEKIVGANGAGDAFAAGVIYGLHEGWDVEASLRLAHAAAAVSLRSLGTPSAILPVADCLAMAERWGWREAGRA